EQARILMAAGVQQPSSSSSLATTPDAPEIGQPAIAPPEIASLPASPQETMDTLTDSFAQAAPDLAFFPPYELLRMARAEFEAGRMEDAITLLSLFAELYPSGSDEAWWLFGQSLEADSPSRDTLRALSYYRRLVSEFPQSGHLTAARGRISFIERFFLNIR
ncbi:MAG: tetratricopeptide repeat protein, partial [Treponema sp.]|nr:tetratricopeptide repeat protein [Treponema sp.]